jgi:hypothetical protein
VIESEYVGEDWMMMSPLKQGIKCLAEELQISEERNCTQSWYNSYGRSNPTLQIYQAFLSRVWHILQHTQSTGGAPS